jgi:1-deoxy-D-xylulose-5-phosphate reductoisomerase
LKDVRNIAVIGSTGSIGRSALSLVDLHPDQFRVVTLAAQKNAPLLREQCRKHNPKVVALFDADAACGLANELPDGRVLSGAEGVIEAACHPEVDTVLSSVTGAAGLLPTYHAIQSGKDIALANKESLVMAGDLLIPMVEREGVRLLPVDSEHSALHQCLRGSRIEEVQKLLLTASGGPFRNATRESLSRVTIDEALNHPTWNMGPKISIDSATLMNKGLEVIEAHHLFQVPPQQIEVVIHPQSIVHSVVEFIDGTMLAQMSITDMRSSILYALSFPERWNANLPKFELSEQIPLTFEAPNTALFPCLGLAYQALEKGQTYPAVLNAANEVAVEFFLTGAIPFLKIPVIIERVLSDHRPTEVTDLETVLEIDRQARESARRAATKVQTSL